MVPGAGIVNRYISMTYISMAYFWRTKKTSSNLAFFFSLAPLRESNRDKAARRRLGGGSNLFRCTVE